MNDELWYLFRNGLKNFSLFLEDNYRSYFDSFLKLYFSVFDLINISSIKDQRNVIIRHFLDSLSVIPVLKRYNLWKENFRYVDLGSGGGFPGIPLKIIQPSWSIDLAEVNKKKTCFLNEVIFNLLLKNIEVVDSSISKITKQYDVLLVRAFGTLNKIIKESRKYKVRYIVAYKGKKNTFIKEIKEINKLNFKCKINIEKIKCPYLIEDRHIVIVKI